MTAAAPPIPNRPPPTLDPDALGELLLDVGGDIAVLHRFLDDFLALWPTRLDRLRSAVTDGDVEQVDEVLLSIRCSAQMLGVLALAARAEHVRAQVRRGERAVADVPLRELAALGEHGCRALTAARDGQRAALRP